VRSIKKHIELDIEIIDMRSISHLDVDLVLKSVTKTGHLIIADCAGKYGSIAGELISSVAERGMVFLKAPPVRLGSLNYPAPTSHYLIDSYYVTPINILDAIYDILDISRNNEEYVKIKDSLNQKSHKDVPNTDYQGPF
jgi:pyruvate dehydrogenase E1 component beta subunit